MGCSITLDPTSSPVGSNQFDSGEETGGASAADASIDAIPSQPLDATEASAPEESDVKPRDANESPDIRSPGPCVSVVGPTSEYLICTDPLVESDAAAQ